MKKYKSLIIWITALVLVFLAAYVVYDKYSSQIVLQPPVPDSFKQPGRDSSADGAAADSGTSADNSSTRDNDNGNSKGSNNTGSGDSLTGESDSGDTSIGNSNNSGGTDPEEDVIMVPDFTLKDLDGNEVSLSDYRGKIVVLNFWAVWCKYCIEEMPDFNQLDKELAAAGDAVILAVNVNEPYDTVNDYLTKNDIGIKVLLDEDGHVALDIFGVSGYPTTFVVNKDGSLYTYLPGKTDLKTMRTVIDMTRENAPLR